MAEVWCDSCGIEYMEATPPVGLCAVCAEAAQLKVENAALKARVEAVEAVVKARVTVRDPMTRAALLVREAYGGAGIKVYGAGKKNKDGIDISGTPVALENDYKSAQADAMKKAISLFGICSDIYEPVVDKREDEREEAEAVQVKAATAVKQSIKIDPMAQDALRRAYGAGDEGLTGAPQEGDVGQP